MDTAAALKKVFIFKDVQDSVLQIVARAAEEMSAAAGETIIRPGVAPNALYVIKSGTVRLSADREGIPPVLIGSGETMGEVALLDEKPFAGSAVALERADLLVLRAGKLAKALEGQPEAGYQLYRAIARSLAGRVRRALGMVAFAQEKD